MYKDIFYFFWLIKYIYWKKKKKWSVCRMFWNNDVCKLMESVRDVEYNISCRCLNVVRSFYIVCIIKKWYCYIFFKFVFFYVLIYYIW